MNQTDIYRKAIQRTFAELYSVPAESVDVVWNREGVTVQCARKTERRLIEQQHARMRHESPHDGQHLLLATRKGSA
jgi:hypothetical protein